MSTTTELIAAELARHSDEVFWESKPSDLTLSGTLPHDSGGIWCSCKFWMRPVEPDGTRPLTAWREHVAESIQRAIATDTVVDTLNAVNQRVTARRLGKSVMREMDQDIVTLRAAASTLTLLIGDADV